MDFILDILTRSWILSWISSRIFPELARSWQDIQDVERWEANKVAQHVLGANIIGELALWLEPEVYKQKVVASNLAHTDFSTGLRSG